MVAPITFAESVPSEYKKSLVGGGSAGASPYREGTDGYEKVTAELERHRGTMISVPELSELLGVKTTTINARLRREKTPVMTVGRTNYVRGELALPLADLHQYALRGWPTLQEVSRKAGIKSGTLKARCEKGKLEGHVDLTKRLRINPSEVPGLALERHRGNKCPNTQGPKYPKNAQGPNSKGGNARSKANHQSFMETPAVRRPFTLPPAPEPRVQFITERDYGFEARRSEASTVVLKKNGASHVEKRRGALVYNPEQPFSISECAVGKSVKYEQHDGTIVQLMKDPFNPMIKLALPNHDEPLMREILLRVSR